LEAEEGAPGALEEGKMPGSEFQGKGGLSLQAAVVRLGRPPDSQSPHPSFICASREACQWAEQGLQRGVRGSGWGQHRQGSLAATGQCQKPQWEGLRGRWEGRGRSRGRWRRIGAYPAKAVGFLEAWRIPGVAAYAFCLFSAKLVAYTFPGCPSTSPTQVSV